jgi:hypothetical protein
VGCPAIAGDVSRDCSVSRYAIFDRDSKFDADRISFLKATGLKPKRTSVQASWQNGIAERSVGSAWREILNHVIAPNEQHLRRLIRDCAAASGGDGNLKSTAGRPASPLLVATGGAGRSRVALSSVIVGHECSKQCPPGYGFIRIRPDSLRSRRSKAGGTSAPLPPALLVQLARREPAVSLLAEEVSGPSFRQPSFRASDLDLTAHRFGDSLSYTMEGSRPASLLVRGP